MEILIAVLGNAKFASSLTAFLGLIGAIIFYSLSVDTTMWFSDREDLDGFKKKKASQKSISKWCLALCFVSLPFAMLPTIDDIWRVRIGLIKLQLASPENLQKGADVIERIGKKLECKYLGCKEKTPAPGGNEEE